MSKKRIARLDIILAGNGGAPDECWNWEFGKTLDGYGRVTVNGRRHYIHRVSYETYVGPIPDGLVIDHECHNRGCWNQAHLRVVTRAQNNQHRQQNSTNASGYRGVYFDKRWNKWQAQVRHRGRTIHAGYFNTPEEAGEAAEAKRRELGFLGSDERGA